MFNKLRNILCTAPQLKTHEAQKILLERMPYMSDECLPETVESIRLSLIQECVSKIRFGEEDPSDVLKLVALEKRLPFNELTPAIIKRTLLDMQSKLLDGSSFQRNDVLNS